MGNKDYCTEASNMVWDAIHVGPGPRIIVACNKSDDLLALSTKRVKVRWFVVVCRSFQSCW
jgi:hypothetical protein